jgi:plasmid stabilization system protein ParE
MVVYKVVISDEAKANLQRIFAYLRDEESMVVAEKVRDGIIETIEELSTLPHRHGIVNEISDEKVVYRRALKWSYKIIFTVDDDEVLVLVVDIIHAKRNPQYLKDKFGA